MATAGSIAGIELGALAPANGAAANISLTSAAPVISMRANHESVDSRPVHMLGEVVDDPRKSRFYPGFASFQGFAGRKISAAVLPALCLGGRAEPDGDPRRCPSRIENARIVTGADRGPRLGGAFRVPAGRAPAKTSFFPIL